MGERDSDGLGELIPLDSGYASEVAELRTAIESTRQQIADNLDDLQHQVEQSLDWRGWVQENPWKAAGLAFAAGFYLGIR